LDHRQRIARAVAVLARRAAFAPVAAIVTVAPALAAAFALALALAAGTLVALTIVTLAVVASLVALAAVLAGFRLAALVGLGFGGGLLLAALVLEVDVEARRELVAAQDLARRALRLHGAQQAEIVL